ncbi:MAG: M13 family metallopeptidase [Pseudomonadota bacterium]
MKRLILGSAILAALAILPCAQAADSNAPHPQFGSWGYDLGAGDPASKPGDNFFRYANGKWFDSTPIPSDKAAYSMRMKMSDLIEQRLHDLMETAAQSNSAGNTLDGQIGAFYLSFMDEARIDKLGAGAIAQQLSEIKQAKTRDQLAAMMGRNGYDFQHSLFGYSIDIDLKDPSKYAFYLSQSGLGLPDRDYYLLPNFAKEKAAYQAHIATMLGLLNWPKAEASSKAVVEFETAVAKASWSKSQQRDMVSIYNPMSLAELEKLAPGFAWKPFLHNAKMGDLKRVIVAEKSAFPQLTAVYGKTSVDTLRAWHAFHLADNAAPFMSKAFDSAHFALHSKLLQGQQEQQARWKRAIAAVSGNGGDERFGSMGTMGFGVGQLYADKFFPPAVKSQVEAMVTNLKDAYRKRIEQLDWMDTSTKQEALKKLDTYTIKVGYPDHARDYRALRVDRLDLIGNVRRAAAADWAFYSGRFNGPVDKSDWSMTPQTNNAYNGSLRDIVFPAGILQAPIFDVNADPAINYGATGGIIGHELTHGFDDQGRTIDASGALRDWWTAKDAATFAARAAVLGAQYSKFEPVPGAKINGELTMGENIADLGGLTLALDAYRASLKGQPAPVLDGLTGDQRVFLGWAQAWRGKANDAYVRKQVVSDPHSPRQFRVDGPVRNIDAWYDAFGVKPGDALYVAPADRVRIW